MKFAGMLVAICVWAALATAQNSGSNQHPEPPASMKGSPTATASATDQKAEPLQAPAAPQANSGAPKGAGAPPLTSPQPQDSTILQGHIQQALLNEPSLNSSHISVNVTDSAIELAGNVGSIMEKETAERIARSFDGNRQFTNKLLVAGAGTSAVSSKSSLGSNGSSPR